VPRARRLPNPSRQVVLHTRGTRQKALTPRRIPGCLLIGCLGPVGFVVVLVVAFAGFATAWLAPRRSPVEVEWRRLRPQTAVDGRALDVRASRPEMVADGVDSLVVTIVLRDAEGRLVPTSSGTVTLRVSAGTLTTAVADLDGGVARACVVSPLAHGGSPTIRRTLRLAHRLLAGDWEPGPGPLAQEPSARIAIVAEGLGLRGGASVRLVAPATAEVPRRGRFHGHPAAGSGEWLMDLVPSADGFVARMRRTDRTGGLLVATWNGRTIFGHALVQVAEDADLAALKAAGLGLGGLPSLARPLPGGGLALLGPPIDFLPVATHTPRRLRLSLVADDATLSGDGRAGTRLTLRCDDADGNPVAGSVVRWRLLSSQGFASLFNEQTTTGKGGTATASLCAQPCGGGRPLAPLAVSAEVGDGPAAVHAQTEVTPRCASPPNR
jgi:hypothetical protein